LQRRTFLRGGPAPADVRWLRSDGEEMSGAAWCDPDLRVLGMLLDGHHIGERDARGEPRRGNTLLVLLNASNRDVSFVLPDPAALIGDATPAGPVSRWELAISSTWPVPPATPVPATSPFTLVPHSSAILKL